MKNERKMAIDLFEARLSDARLMLATYRSDVARNRRLGISPDYWASRVAEYEYLVKGYKSAIKALKSSK